MESLRISRPVLARTPRNSPLGLADSPYNLFQFRYPWSKSPPATVPPSLTLQGFFLNTRLSSSRMMDPFPEVPPYFRSLFFFILGDLTYYWASDRTICWHGTHSGRSDPHAENPGCSLWSPPSCIPYFWIIGDDRVP